MQFSSTASGALRGFSNTLSSFMARKSWNFGSRMCSSFTPRNADVISLSFRSLHLHPSDTSGTLLAINSNRGSCSHVCQLSAFHTSIATRGLEEFFDDPKNWGQPTVKAGRAWSKDELRLKDFVTLHKLWYVLLKEKNMLLTMETEAERLDKFMPSAERINKVQVSMANLQAVLEERQEALTELQTGHKEEHPGEWQYTPFGYKRYVRPKEYVIPKYMNRYWSTKRKWYDPSVGRHLTRWYEQQARRRARERGRRRSQLLKLRERFPDSDIWEDR